MSRKKIQSTEPAALKPQQRSHFSRSQSFQATRQHHTSELAEDYTELIAELLEKNGEARVCEIAESLGVSHVTSLRTIRRLQKQGYVKTSPHKPIVLTAKGRNIAERAKERHQLLVDFLLKLGVPKAIAEVDIEGAEHHISETTLGCIRKFIDRHE